MTQPAGVFEVAQLASTTDADLLEERLRSATAVFRAGGATSVHALRGVEHPDRFHLLIEWPSLDAHTAFRATPLRQQWRDLVDAVVTEGPAGSHYRIVAASSDN